MYRQYFYNHICIYIYYIQVVTSPGDIIYYPVDFWHQTVNLDTPSIAITGMYSVCV